MYKIIGALRCPVCGEIIQLNDKVIMDEMNTIIHIKCYFKSSHSYSVKDQGAFHKMILKYDYFKD